MINNYLKQIIQLDKTIETERHDIEKEVEKSEEETKELIQNIADTVLNQTSKHCQTQYDQKIALSEKEKEEEINKAKEESQKLLDYYRAHKEQALDLVLNSLL